MSKVRSEYETPSRIIRVQFSLLSPEEILKNSVVEVTRRETYMGGMPVDGGLFDPRMGVLEPGMICPTDGLTHIDTPGYFGHIELARPVFFIQHIKEIMKVLKCVCFKCSKLLIDKSQHAHILNYTGEKRWDYVQSVVSKRISRCGDHTGEGCGCLQPDKIKLEGMATLHAHWLRIPSSNAAGGTASLKLTPEIVLKIFRRISDEDVNFIGFSSNWSRPEWMVCQILPVPPPAVRPSVKLDAQQRSEDDLTHIYINIIKINNDLKNKIQDNANPNVIEGMTLDLQYFIAMIANNKVKGASPIAQRNGRPLQCIMGRLNFKNGRIRGNLMGKRVDFSARSVITGDPNLSVRQLGVPMKIAMNITKPITVNDLTHEFLTKLIQNGPDVYPGAKILERKSGERISLRYVDRNSIVLRNGDIVHRHMMDGDYVLFNRQPSLHRMSMMCHEVKVMRKGDTFRMNVSNTKPYNADFDGDEMNMHMAQNILAETELRLLASTTSQIVSPSSNVPIIAIYQDSLLGSYRITREGVKFSARDAMNLLMSYPNVNPATLFERSRKEVTNFEVLSQIMPPLTLKYKTKLWDADKKEDPATSNHYLEIYNGRYIRGQIEKSVLGGASKGILHRICNDYGKKTAAEFIDNIQNIVTEYMKVSSYSVGVSDLMSNRETHTRIIQAIQDKELEVAALIQKLHAGAFENNTSYSNKTEFEAQVNNVLNDATKKTDEISRQSLNADNRFLMIVNSGSKGSLLNISHMISCLGQVNVDSKRVPYGFDSRTLPHFCKFDDSPGARGFIKNSYIGGLNAHELFFHAMGGRIGLIDTAVKSVSWETPIVLLEKGKPVYTEIGRWIDGIIDNSSPESVQKYEEKNMELVNIDSGVVYVPTMDENGVVTWEEITAVTRHDPGNVLYEIKSLGGRSVIVTESKSLLIWNAEKHIFNEVLTPEIKVGDCLPVTMELCNPPTQTYKQYEYASLLNMINDIQSGKSNVIPNELLCCDNFSVFTDICEEVTETNNAGEKVFHTYSQEDANKLAMLFNRKGRFVELRGNAVVLNCSNKYEQTENVVLDPIVEIIPLSPEKYPKMYDLTIPTTLNFGLANGLQVRDTSQTGYIQRRLIKGLEDLKVEYDLTVRNSSGKVIQFSYGEDSFDPMFVENQSLPIVTMSTQDIYMHYDMVTTDKTDGDIKSVFNKSASARMGKQKDELRKTCKKYIDMMMDVRDVAVKNIFNNKNLDSVLAPVAFIHIINNIQGNLGLAANSIVDITPLEAFQLIEEYFDKLNLLNYAKPNMLFETLYFYYLNPRELLFVKRFHRKGLILLLETVFLKYKQAIVNPGEMVGVVAGQSIGEPTTQLTLNSFVYETEILVRDDKGVVTSFQIGDFAKWGIETTSKMEYMADKDTTYAELSKFYEVPSATEDGNTVWRRIEAVTKHPVINEDGTNTMVKVTTKGNREIIATKAKSFLQLIDGKMQGVNGSDLKVGDYLPVSKVTYEIAVSRGYIKDIYKMNVSDCIPNIVAGELVMEDRAGRCPDLEFDQIVSIEEVPNTTDYAYDLTVEDTRNFDCINGINLRDTFHTAGVASKSNVTRGVPRIEEILRLTKNPKNPSMTVFLKSADEGNPEKAKQFANMMEHTRLSDVVSSVQICFDPDEFNTRIEEDRKLVEQYYEFSRMLEECNGSDTPAEQSTKSKWIVRMEMDTETLLDKNITMDDIHFTVKNGSLGTDVDCVYADYNSDKLVFRVRMSNIASSKKRKGTAEPLDQTDEIHILKKFQDDLLNNTILRGVSGIVNVLPRKLNNMVSKVDGKYEKKDVWVLDTTGSNLLETLGMDYIDSQRTHSNDIREMFDVLGIEAARQVIHDEIVDVLEFSGAYANYHHLSLLCDRMTTKKDLVSIFRTGLFSDNIGPIAKATFEVHTEVLLDAARFGEADNMRGVSANVMCGQPGYYGTNSFQLVLDMNEMSKLAATQVSDKEPDPMEELLGKSIDDSDVCPRSKIEIRNNIGNMKRTDPGLCDDGYNAGF